MKNKRGDKIISVYWFVILFIVAAAIVYMSALFYGAPYDARIIESELLTNKIADCLSQGGYLKENIFENNTFKNNFLEECNLNFDVEDVYGWGEQEQYYVEISIYEFNQISVDGFGDEVLDIVEGNSNLKTSFILEKAKKEKSNKEVVVIHYTAGDSAKGAIESMRDNDLSIHYMLEKDGNVISINNIDELEIEKGYKAFKKETKTAQHVGCITKTGEERDSCQVKNEIPEPGEKCCVDFNKKSIGIEIINLGYACDAFESCKNSGIEINEEDWEKYVAERYNDESKKGLIWEEFTEEQISSLVDLVARISLRNNIPIDREHIIGHDEVAPGYKWDPGPAFPWEQFMNRLEERTKLDPSTGRTFYVLDKEGNQYAIKILSIIGKTEKNVK